MHKKHDCNSEGNKVDILIPTFFLGSKMGETSTVDT